MEEATTPDAAPDEDTPAGRRKAKAAAAAERFLNRGGKKAPAKKTAAPAKKTTARKSPAKKTATPAAPADAGSEAPAAAPARPRRTAAAGPLARRTPPAEQEKTTFYSERINLTTTPAQKKMLKLAGVEDGIDTTARIRAMIALYEEDERLRKRIDKLAQHWR
ncbi:hypothetical protein [Streptomyces sp. BPTC-684]|uniref:hypothetical protein n=1 Tax=Streptomyces sp. BPTC-684 TaxID=3043734 RepID=UPI0024B140AB|nr:hypothetical protein [Streptomyces sp. BPTC-684]WHM41117.1 hypothetical protein QIY60_32505 [Streptomyces sp. BPTC-684]